MNRFKRIVTMLLALALLMPTVMSTAVKAEATSEPAEAVSEAVEAVAETSEEGVLKLDEPQEAVLLKV